MQIKGMHRIATLLELSRGILAAFVLPRILGLTAFNNERSTFCRLGGKKSGIR
jgi:hypothetical protein